MLQNIPKEKVLEIVKLGPTFPAKIAKAIGGGGDTMLIGAILSTLISSGDIKVSTLKVGGSPLYYVPEQESKLEDFLSYMNEKDKKTFRLLKENKVLQDSEQDPLTRVSLRAIKDFAKMFEIEAGGQKILFWRFYSVSKEESLTLAKSVVSIAKPVEVETPVLVEKVTEQTQYHKPSLIIDPKPVEKPIEAVPLEKPVSVEHHVTHHAEYPIGHPVDVVQQVLEESTSPMAHDVKHDGVKHEHEIHKHHDIDKHSKLTKAPKVPKTPKPAKVKESKAPKVPKIEYNFFELILNHVASKKLDVISKEKIKKTEYDLVLKNHNTNEYIYCKAKDKPTISEGDLAPALIFAQNKKMPCLFLSTGELSKTASILITKEFSGLTFERIIVEVKQT